MAQTTFKRGQIAYKAYKFYFSIKLPPIKTNMKKVSTIDPAFSHAFSEQQILLTRFNLFGGL